MKAVDSLVAERAQHPDAADPQQDFLTQTIALVAAVQDVRESAIVRLVLRQVGVEEVDRNFALGPRNYWTSQGSGDSICRPAESSRCGNIPSDEAA